MPASRGEIGVRPSRPVTPESVAEWEAATYPQLARFGRPIDARVVLDDVLPELDEMLADPAAAIVAIVDEL